LKTNKLHEIILDLSLDDLRIWAGSKILNRGKSYQKHVYDLARTENGELLATVSGTDEYDTMISVDDDGELDIFCSCPYDWGPCKHAVAVILQGLTMVKKGEAIPLAAPDDARGFVANYDDDDDDEFDECDQLADVETAVKPILQKKKKAELLAMLVDFSRRFPEIKRDILETDQLQSGDVDKLVCSLSREIEEVTSEDAYYNHWRDEGSLPDYGHIQEQLSALLAGGHADEVVTLGQQLWEQGCEQVGQSHDDGETADEVAECMDIVFEAVEASSMSAADQILWFIEIFLEDEYSLCETGRDFIDSNSYGQRSWQEAVISLQARLAKTPKPKGDDFSSRYHREKVLNWLIVALERSGEQEQVIPLLKKEAHLVQCYGRLVDLLLEQGQVSQARKWCIKGYEHTKNNAVGIASRLQEKLRDLAKQEKNPELVAAYRAQDFFARPSLQNYQDLHKACKAVPCWAVVHGAVIHFLEKGTRPDLTNKNKDWPLPAPEVTADKGNSFRTDFPIYGVLIDIAIHEKRLDDVVDLHQSLKSNGRWHNSRDEEVAKAVSASHPDVALAIWHTLALNQIGEVKPAAYAIAASYLSKMRQVYLRSKQLAKWQNLITTIRTEHKRKIRLLEILDSLEGKRLID
jgi:uncharacterized Zn finger protein